LLLVEVVMVVMVVLYVVVVGLGQWPAATKSNL